MGVSGDLRTCSTMLSESYVPIFLPRKWICFHDMYLCVKITVLSPEIESKKEKDQKNDTWMLESLSKFILTSNPIFKWNQPHL